MKFFTRRLYLIFSITLFSASAYGITASFSYTKRNNCAPTIVEFLNNSTKGAGISYTWDFGLGAEVVTNDPSKKEQVYTKPGQYTVTLKVTDGTSTAVFTETITIAQGPKAGFTTSSTAGCTPLNVKYTSTSLAGGSEIVSTNWDFRNGDHKTGQAVEYNYYKAGKYGVLLKVTDKNGCYSYTEQDSLVEVANKPVANFKASDTASCSPPLNVSFTNLSSGSGKLTYLWDYGNGKTSTDFSNSNSYDAKGKFNVKLTVTDGLGCTSTLEKKGYIKVGNPTGTIQVFDSKRKPFTNTRLCSGTYTFVFSEGAFPVSSWTIVDNTTTTTITGPDSIIYTVKDTGTIKINFAYGSDLSCTDVVLKTFTKNNVKADFTTDITRFCSLPQKLNFSNTSVNSVSYNWYVGGKQFSVAKTPSYTVSGSDIPTETYEQLYSHKLDSISIPIKLIVTNNEGCSDSLIRKAYLSIPVARFIPDKTSGCAPLKVTFADSSRSAYKLDTYTYKVDGQLLTSSERKPLEYIFSKPGIYNVTEIVKSGSCADTSQSVRILVGEKLVPDFTVSPAEVCNDDKIQIVASSNNNKAISSWNLKSPGIFDLTSFNLPDTMVTVYSDTTGFKSITLQVNYNGCLSDVTKKDVYKIKGPAGNFTTKFSCDSSLVYRFKSKISPATSVTWNLNSETITNKDSIRYKFPISSDYSVKLTAADNASNCTLTRTKTVKVRQVKADFALKDSIYCAGDSVKLDASPSKDYINSCFNEGFLWYFGDDSPPRRVTSPFYSHIYTSRGKFELELIANADNACTDTFKHNIYIKKPTAEFTVDKDKGCVPRMHVNFANTSTDPSIISFVWNFGDGTTDSSQLKNVVHTFEALSKKTYAPSLTVYDAYQCSGDYMLPVSLIGVNADFQADDNAICAGQKVTFTPLAQKIDSLVWDFGDGTSSKTVNYHTYNTLGVFTPKLTVYSDKCSETITKNGYIYSEKADGSFVVSDSVLKCYPDTVSFSHLNLNGSPAAERTWTIGSNPLALGNSKIDYVFSKPGNYKVYLDLRTLNGCKAASSKTISITGPQAKFSFSPSKICYGDNVNFKVDSIKNVTQWKLLFGDGATSSANPASHVYTSKGKIVPAINLVNNECNVTLAMDTLSVDKVTAQFVQKDSAAICQGSLASFKNVSLYSDYWSWKINDIFKTNDKDFTEVAFNKKGNNTIMLIASSDDCSDTLVRTYVVHENPSFKITGDSILCKDKQPVQLSVNQTNGWKIKWSPTTGISNTESFTVTASPENTATYKATVTDIKGCSSIKEKTVYVNRLPNFVRIPLADTTISIGDKIPLRIIADTVGLTYTWAPGNNISCLNCSSPVVRPLKDATYNVRIQNSCVDFGETFIVKVIFDFHLEAPSAFTPNGDSNNDIFRFEQRNIAKFELKIFNRWGQLVFTTNDMNEGWDGTVNGHLQNVDTYSYFVKAETETGYKFEKSGNFLLLK